MKRQEDSFEDIAFELEKQTYKSKFLPFMLVAIVVFSIIGTVFLTLSLSEKAKPIRRQLRLARLVRHQIVWKMRKLKQNNSLKVLLFLQKKAVPFFGQLKRQSRFP